MTKTLEGQTALVTGAGRGIGRGIATELAKSGAAVGLFARGRNDLDEVAAHIEREGGRALVLTGDVTNGDDVERAVRTLTEQHGPIDLLVNNAGRSQPYGPIGTVDPHAWWETQAIHALGTLLFMTAVIPSMADRGRGRIVNVASKAGTMVAPGSSAYCVSKATVIRLSEHAHAEHRDSGLAVFAVHPGSILTDMVLNSLSDPAAPKRPLNPNMAENAAGDIHRVGVRVAALAAGGYDALAGGYLDLEEPLDEALARAQA